MLAANIKRRRGGKNSIQMRADGNGRGVRLKTRTRCEKVSGGVDGCSQSKVIEAQAEPCGAGVLGKRRSWDGGDGELKIGDLALMAGKPIEDAMDTRVGREAIHLLGERASLGRLGLPKIPYAKRHQKRWYTSGEARRQRNRVD